MAKNKKPIKQIYRGRLTFEIFVSATSKTCASEKILRVDRKIIKEKMNYMPGSLIVEETPYEILEEDP